MAERLALSSRLQGLDLKLMVSVLLLTAMGLVLLLSADHAQDTTVHFTRQLYFGLLGTLVLAAFAAVPARMYYALAYLAYGLALLGLLAVLGLGISGFGARRWLSLGGVGIQPSEPAKIAFVLAAARLLSYRHGPVSWWKLIGIVAVLGLPPMVLVLFQPDLGTATLFPVLGAAMLAWFGLPLKFFIFLLLPLLSLLLTVYPWVVSPLIGAGFVLLWRSGVRWGGSLLMVLICAVATVIAPMAWNQLEPYQQRRLTGFLNPSFDPLGSGYQVIQSKVAIGSGGVNGRGYLQGTQTQLRFLPQQHTDFIFALAGEEFGLLGTSAIIVLLTVVVWRGYELAGRAKNRFIGMVSAGVTTMLLYHAAVNIGMSVGILPVTGLPLPFLSYGGSFLITCMAGVGILLSAGIHRREH